MARKPMIRPSFLRRPRPAQRQLPARPLLAPARTRVQRQRAVLEARQKPRSILAGWGNVPVIGGIINFVRNIIYPRERFRQLQRQRIGTGFGPAAKGRMLQARMSFKRGRIPQGREQAQVLRNRTAGLRGTIVSQNSRGRIHGVPKYKGKAA